MTVADIILAAFAISNSVRVVAYVPQIVKIAKDNEGAAAVSNGTWALFGVSHLSTVAYAFLVIGDLYMALLFTANLLCCLAIIGLTVWKRRKFRALRLEHVLRMESETANPGRSLSVEPVACSVASFPQPRPLQMQSPATRRGVSHGFSSNPS